MRLVLSVVIFTGAYLSLASFVSFPRSTYICPISTLGRFTIPTMQLLGLLLDATILVNLNDVFHTSEDAGRGRQPMLVGFVLLVRQSNPNHSRTLLTICGMIGIRCCSALGWLCGVLYASFSKGMGAVCRQGVCREHVRVVVVNVNPTALRLTYRAFQRSCEKRGLTYPDRHPRPTAPEHVHVHPNCICKRYRSHAIQFRVRSPRRSQFKYFKAPGNFDSRCHLLLPDFTIDEDPGVLPEDSIIRPSSSHCYMLFCSVAIVLEHPTLSSERRGSDAPN